MNAGDLIKSSLRLIGAIESGEVPSADESADALVILNQMLDSWNAERLNIFTQTIANFALTVGVQTYTYGAGGTFNGVRPANIERANIVSLNNPAQPLELPLDMLTDAQWSAIPVKAVSSALPLKFYDDGDFPFRNLSFWPIPSVPVQVNIYVWTALSAFPDLVTDVTFPPGYLKALRYNLAVDLAPEFGVQIPPEVGIQALMSKAVIKSINIGPLDLQCDRALTQRGGRYNWLADTGA